MPDSELSIELLGAPKIALGDEPIEVDTRKATALLAYLALTARDHRRDALAGLLWPDYDDAHARAALRRTLSTLNGALKGEHLAVSRETIGIDASSVRLDVEVYNQLSGGCEVHRPDQEEGCDACLRALSAAAASYGGDFMAGFALRDSPDFDDWQYFQAEELRQRNGSVLDRLARAHKVRGAFDQAIEYARRRLSTDSLHEPAHRELMELYALSGRRAAALKQYRECVRILDGELGVAPLPETTELYRTIREGQAGPQRQPSRAEPKIAVPSPTGPKSQPAAPPPLVGRSAEWAALESLYESALPGRFIVIEGEAGIGKTRLADELVDLARRQGGSAIFARCREGEVGLAYGVAIEMLRSAVSGPIMSDRIRAAPALSVVEAGRLLPEVLELLPVRPSLPPEGPGAQARFLEGVTQVLITASVGDPPGIMLVDDLQWIDEGSLDLLTHVVRRLPECSLYVVATLRTEDVSSGHRAARLSTEARRSGVGASVRLERLLPSDVAELVALVLPQEGSSEELGRRLFEETEGLPYFLVEYLEVVARGDLDQGGLPQGVRDLLQARVGSLDEVSRQLLDAAAVAGGGFDFDTVRAVSGRDEDESVAALETLINSNLLTELAESDGADLSPSYDFTHEKLRALVYGDTSLARRRLLHRRTAETLIRGFKRRRAKPPYGPIAHHYRAAGRDHEAALYSFMAGDEARSLYANEEALVHYRSALALGYPNTASAHEAIGDLHTLRGSYDEALAGYETAAARTQGADLARLEQKLGHVQERLGDPAAANSHFSAALSLLSPGPETISQRASLVADRSLAAHHVANHGEAKRLAGEALAMAEEAGEGAALTRAYNILGILATTHKDAEGARSYLGQSLALARRLEDHTAVVAALNNLALAHRAAGRADEAIALMSEAIALCAFQGDRHREAALHSNMADLLHARGRPDEAMTHLKHSASLFATLDESAETKPGIWKLVEW